MGEAKLRDRGVYSLPPWTPFGRAKRVPVSAQQVAAHAAAFGKTPAEVQAEIDRQLNEEIIFQNSRYQVAVRIAGSDLIHLSIKRLDRRPPGIERWRDFQRIKNELVGPECTAVEVYPPASQLVDTSNQYHLWVFSDPAFRLPFGFADGRHVHGEADDASGARQQPFEDSPDAY